MEFLDKSPVLLIKLRVGILEGFITVFKESIEVIENEISPCFVHNSFETDSRNIILY